MREENMRKREEEVLEEIAELRSQKGKVFECDMLQLAMATGAEER